MNVLRDAVLRKNGRFGARSFDTAHIGAYVHGQNIRSISWRATARSTTGQILTRMPDRAITWATLVDRSPSMLAGRERSLLSSAQEAVCFWRSAGAASDRWLELMPSEPFDPTGTLRVALQRLPRGSALLVITDESGIASVPDPFIKRLAARADCTALIARDPWAAGLPLRGFVAIADLESDARGLFFIGETERARYIASVARAQEQLRVRFQRAGWRCGLFGEKDSVRALLSAFANE